MSSVAVDAQSFFCPLCRNDCNTKDITRFCSDHNDGGICGSCIGDYIKQKVDKCIAGLCPRLSCPLCLVESKPRILKYSIWTKSSHIAPEITAKYNELATSLLAFFCGGCHTSRSLSVGAEPLLPKQIASARKKLHDKITATGQNFEDFEKELETFCDGILSVEEFFNTVTTTFLSSLISAKDCAAWDLFKNVLLLIDDPERRANLHLRYLRSRPRIW